MPLSSVVGAQSIVRPGVCTSSTKPASPYDGQVIYMTDVDQTAVWDGSAWVVLAPITGNRNVLINGAFNVWQRGTSIPLPLGGGGYVADRWWYYNNGFTSSLTRELCGSTLPQFRYCARIQRNSGQTGTAAMVLFSPQETINSVRFAGKNATLSFYARASSGLSSATALGINVFTGTGTDQSNFGAGAYTGLTNAGGIAPTLTTSWQRFSVTCAIGSTATEIGIQIAFTPTGTAGASDYFEITGIQLEEGAVATPFEFEDYGTTLAKCQRYYYVQASGNFQVFAQGFFFNSAQWEAAVYFPVTMRVAPTLVIASGSNYYNTREVSPKSFSSLNIARAHPNGALLYVATSGATTGDGAGMETVNAASSVAYSSEL